MEKNRIDFHIAAGDYFGTLATTLDLLRQAIEDRGYRDTDAKLLERLRDELVYLQKHHAVR